MEELVRFIMAFKKHVGDFSMVMFYDDHTNDEESYVVRVQFANGQVEHFRSSSFNDSLVQAFEYFMGIIENKE